MKPTLWTKDYILLGLLNFFIVLIFYMDMLLATEIATSRFHTDASIAGLASGVFILGALVSRFVVGRYLDLFGRKRMLCVGIIFYFIFSLLYHAVDGLSFLFFIRFFHGLFFGLTATASNTIVASIVPPSRRGEGIGFFALGLILGTAVGPFLGILLSRDGDYTNALYVCDALSAIGIVVALFIKVPKIPLGFKMHTQMKSFKMRYLFEKKALPIAAVALFCGASYSAVMSFIGAYATSLNLISGGSLFFLFYAMASLFSRPAAGKLMDRRGNNFVMYPALAILALGYIAIAVARADGMLLLGAVCVGIGYGALLSGGQTIAVQRVPLQRFSLAISTFFIFLDLGTGFGPYILGQLVKGYGFSAVYFCSALLASIGLACYIILIGRWQKSETA